MADVFEGRMTFLSPIVGRSKGAFTGYRASTPKKSKAGSVIHVHAAK